MVVLFIVSCLIIAFLIFLMFIILKRTVRTVNDQTKSYFISKLQGYDDLIKDKEAKLEEIEEFIKNRNIGKEENKKEISNGGYAFDTDVIDLFNETHYQDKNLFELNRKIDEKFVVNYEELIRDFLTFCNTSKNYKFCIKLRNKIDYEEIYRLKSLTDEEREKEYKKILTQKEYRVYDAFKVIVQEHSVENFVSYLDQLVDLNSPKVVILVGNKKENYNYLSDLIETRYNERIYRGIKIIYRNKVYDFSLSERNI